MCMNIFGMDSVIVVDSMDEMIISGDVLAEFEHHEPLSSSSTEYESIFKTG